MQNTNDIEIVTITVTFAQDDNFVQEWMISDDGDGFGDCTITTLESASEKDMQDEIQDRIRFYSARGFVVRIET